MRSTIKKHIRNHSVRVAYLVRILAQSAPDGVISHDGIPPLIHPRQGIQLARSAEREYLGQ